MTDALCDLDKLSKWLCLILFILVFFTCKFLLSYYRRGAFEQTKRNAQILQRAQKRYRRVFYEFFFRIIITIHHKKYK